MSRTVDVCSLEVDKKYKINSVDGRGALFSQSKASVAFNSRVDCRKCNTSDCMTVLSTLDSLCDKITTQQGVGAVPHGRDNAFMDILLESIDSLAYAFLIVPFLYNSQDRLQHISNMFCDIIKSIDQHTSKKTIHKEFLRDTQECLATLCRQVLSEEVAMYV